MCIVCTTRIFCASFGTFHHQHHAERFTKAQTFVAYSDSSERLAVALKHLLVTCLTLSFVRVAGQVHQCQAEGLQVSKVREGQQSVSRKAENTQAV